MAGFFWLPWANLFGRGLGPEVELATPWLAGVSPLPFLGWVFLLEVRPVPTQMAGDLPLSCRMPTDGLGMAGG